MCEFVSWEDVWHRLNLWEYVISWEIPVILLGCPAHCETCAITGCFTCETNYFFHQGDCIESCPAKTYIHQASCIGKYFTSQARSWILLTKPAQITVLSVILTNAKPAMAVINLISIVNAFYCPLLPLSPHHQHKSRLACRVFSNSYSKFEFFRWCNRWNCLWWNSADSSRWLGFLCCEV